MKLNSVRIKRILDIIYDLSISAFSIIDIIFDIRVTYDFYQREKYAFFYISLTIFILAQISYASILTISLESTRSQSTFRNNFISHLWIFIIALPFGQLVPLFLMIQDTFCAQFIEFYKYFQFKSVFLKENTKALHTLSLSDYIKRKAISHIGFIAESIIEAVPQSILQMVFIILYNEYSSIHIFSILMSMTVVVTKGSLLTYSVYKPASVFNFLCFAVDIFGIFACVSWLFCVNNDNLSNASYVIMDHEVWRIAYYYFIILYVIFVLLIILAVLGLCSVCLNIYENSEEHPWKQVAPSMLIYAGCVLLTLPVSLILFTTRFTLIPIFLLRGLDHRRQKSLPFYRQLFNFLLNTRSITDIHHRLMIANWRLAVLAFKHGKRLKITSNKYTLKRCKAIIEIPENKLCLYEIYQCSGCEGLTNYHWMIQQIDVKRFWKDLKKVLRLIADECYQFLKKHKWNMLYSYLFYLYTFITTHINQLLHKLYLNNIYYMLKHLVVKLTNLDWNWNAYRDELYFIMLDLMDSVCEFCIWSVGYICNHVLDITLWKHYMYRFNNMCFQYIFKSIYLIIKNFILAIAQDIVNIYLSVRFLNHKSSLERPYMVILCTWSIPLSWKWNSATAYVTYRYFPPTNINPIPQYRYINARASLWSYFGFGSYTYLLCFVYYFIHSPIRDFWRCDAVRVTIECALCAVVLGGLAPCIICLAIYSLFLPLIFAITSLLYLEWYHLQIILTTAQCILFFMMIMLFPWIWRFVYCDFHLYPYFNDEVSIPAKYSKHVINVYYGTIIRNNTIFDTSPLRDIAREIIEYLPRFHVWNDESKPFLFSVF